MRGSVVILLLCLTAMMAVLMGVHRAVQPRRWMAIDYTIDVEAGVRLDAQIVASRLLLRPPWRDAGCGLRFIAESVRLRCERPTGDADLPADYQIQSPAPGTYDLRLRPDAAARFRKAAAEQTVALVRRRIEAFGADTAMVQQTGPESMTLLLPLPADADWPEETGSEDAPAARPGHLRFQVVDREGGRAFFTKVAERARVLEAGAQDADGMRHPIAADQTGARSTSRAVLERLSDGLTDDRHAIGFHRIVVDPRDPVLGRVRQLSPADLELLEAQRGPTLDARLTYAYEIVYVFTTKGMSGTALADASVGVDWNDRPVVHMRFEPRAAQDLHQLTLDNTNQLIAVMLDDTVHSVPNIKEPISGGRVQIEMGASGQTAFREASELLAVLKSGRLLAPLRKVAERHVVDLPYEAPNAAD